MDNFGKYQILFKNNSTAKKSNLIQGLVVDM